MINFFKKATQKRDQLGDGGQQANNRARHSAPVMKRDDKPLGGDGAQLKQSKTRKSFICCCYKDF